MDSNLQEISNVKKKLFLCGSFHGNNFGDMAILESMILNLQQNFELRVFSKDPEKVRKILKLSDEVKFVNALNILEIFSYIISSDRLAVGGGGLFFDDGILDILNIFSHSQIFVWCSISIFAKLFCKKVFWIGVGVGPLSFFGRLILKVSSYFVDKIYVRDEDSHKVLKDIKIETSKIKQTSDVVFANLKETDFVSLGQKLSKQKYKIGIIIQKKDQSEQLFQLLKELDKFQNRYEINVFATNPKSDKQFLQTVKSETNTTVLETENLDLDDFQKLLSGYDFVFSSRMHGLLLAIQNNSFPVGLFARPFPKQNKTTRMQIDLFSSDLSLRDYDVGLLQKLLEKINKNQDNFLNICKQNYLELSNNARKNFEEICLG